MLHCLNLLFALINECYYSALLLGYYIAEEEREIERERLRFVSQYVSIKHRY
jgi:hypothetical protein